MNVWGRAALAAIFLAASGAAVGLGVPNVPLTPGELMSGPNVPEQGRTAVIAYHRGMLVTFPEAPGSPPGDYQVRAWDIADPTAPQVTQVLGYTQHGFMAHGFIKTGGILNSGYTFQIDDTGFVTAAPDLDFPEYGWLHSGMSRPWGVTTYWSYNDTNVPAEIFLNGNYVDPPLAVFDPVAQTGVIGHAFVFGTLLVYASDQSRTGIATYDITDPSNPVLLDVLTEGSVGGYWPDPVGVNGRLYFFFPHDNPTGGYQVVDVTDPTDLQLVADVDVEGNPQYAQFQDEFAFTERYKIDLRTFEVVLALDEDGGTRSGGPIDTSQFSLPVGNMVITGGLWPQTGMAIWAHQAEPDTRGPVVGYHNPVDGQTGFPVTHSIHVLVHETLQSETINADTVRLRPIVGGSPGAAVPARYFFASNDILSIQPTSDLQPNTTYEVEFVAGGVLDAVGNGMEPYSFRFATGSTVAGGNQRPAVSAFSVDTQPAMPGASVGFQATATDPEAQTLQYRFDFGDGTPPTAWSGSSSASHSYAEPGHYTATVQVRDPEAAIATRTTGVTVLVPPTGAAGTHGSQIALGGDRRLWVVNPDHDTVSVFDADSRNKLREIRTCADPRGVAVDNLDRAWITCHDADRLLVLASDGSRVAEIELGYGAAPFAVAFNGAGSRAFVTLSGEGALVQLDATTLAERSRLPLGPTARALAVADDGTRVLVTRFISAGETGQVWDVAVNGDAMSLADTIELEHQWGVDDRFDGRGVPNYLWSVVIAPGGERAWVVAKKDNVNRGLYQSGVALDQDNTVRTTVAQIDLGAGTEVRDARIDLDNSEQPTAIAFSPLGDYAFVTLQGNNAVLVLDVLKLNAGFSGVSSAVSRIGVGLAPQALLFDPDTELLWAHNFMDRGLSAIDMGDFLGAGAESFPVVARATVATERLAVDVLNGKRIFYNADDPRMSGEGYISCASCHLDGGHDGRTFDFTDRGEGLRNTITLRGRAGMGHGLVHWSANFDEIQDFEHDIRGPFGGTGFLTDPQFAASSDTLGAAKAGLSDDLDDLAAYVASLDAGTYPRSPQRAVDGSMTADAMAGAQVFADAGCADCHAGIELVGNTDLTVALQDVGTLSGGSGGRLGGALSGIDVPTLHGVWATPPYLHDGSAATLADVFLRTGGTTYQAEDGTTSGNVEIRADGHWSLADLAVVRQGEFGAFEPGGSITLNLDGGSGGPAVLRLRYNANYGNASLTVSLNGNAGAVTAPRTVLTNDWQYRDWEVLEHPVNLNAGNNTLTVTYNSGGGFAFDELVVADTKPLLVAADPHLSAAGLSSGQFDQLIAYLEQLDGRPAVAPTIAISSPGSGISGVFDVTGSVTGLGSVQVLVAVNNGPFQAASGLQSWAWSWDTSALADGPYLLTARAVDGVTGTWVETQAELMVDGSVPAEVMFRNGFE